MTDAIFALVLVDPVLRRTLADVLAERGGQIFSSPEAAALALAGQEGAVFVTDSAADPSDVPWASLPAATVIFLGGEAPALPVPVFSLPLPVRLGALIDRIDRQRRQREPSSIAFGPFTLEVVDSALRREGQKPARLTEKERDLLLHLHAAAGTAIERTVLLTKIWGYADGVETHTLETHIYRLRQKLEEDPARPRWLLTDGTGYYLARGE